MKCGLIMKSLCHVEIDMVELMIYERLLKIFVFLMEFEEKVSEPQRLLALEEARKDTQVQWWETHEKKITRCVQC